MSTEYYPWHETLRAHVQKLVLAGKLPHALLLSGPKHLGKLSFARATAAFLHCDSHDQGVACGQCANCRLLQAGTHPDSREVTLEDSRLIKIDQIRELTEWANQTAQRGGFKTVIIHPADQMNQASANALLKSLEEPAANTLLMLVSHMPGRLPATIRSRCQHLNFPIPDRDQALKFLAANSGLDEEVSLLLDIASGAPLAVTEEFNDEYLTRRTEIARLLERLVKGDNPLAVATSFARSNGAQDLTVIYSLFADALRKKLTASNKLIKNKDLISVLDLLCDRLTARSLFSVLDAIARERRAVDGPSNPNQQLLFESLLVEVRQYCSL